MMAEFGIRCPHCKTDLTAQEEWIGMEVERPCSRRNDCRIFDVDIK